MLNFRWVRVGSWIPPYYLNLLETHKGMTPILENKQVGDSPHQYQGLLRVDVILKHHEKNLKQSVEIVEPTKGT